MKLPALVRASACLIGIAPVAALAQEDVDSETILVTAQAGANFALDRANATPGGADVVSHADYADKSVVSLRDTLAFSPGVYLQPRYGQEVRISIRGSGLSRGFHMRGLTLLQDGVPTNLADDNGDFQELEPIFFDHLEVYRGANALRFGSGTLGGAINGVTPNGRNAHGLYLRGDAGSFSSVRGLVSGGVASDRVDAWAGLSADTSDGDRQNVQRSSVRFHGNVGMAFSDVVTSRLYVSLNTINQREPGALTRTAALTTPRQANPGNIIGKNARDIDSIRLQNRTSFDWGSLKLDVGGFINVKSLYHPIFQLLDQESVDRGGYFRADYDSDLLALTIGGELRIGDVRAKRFINVAGKRGAQTLNAEQDARTANIYGEARIKPVAGLNLIVGGIYADGMRQQRQTFNAFAGGPVDVLGRADFSEFSPKFGVLVDASPDIQVYANYSRSAEFPGFIELGQVAAFVPLDPQRAWTAEIGTRGQTGMVSFDIAAYRADLKGEMLQFIVGQNIPASTFNADKTRHEGIEAAVELNPLDWLRLRQVYTYSNFRFRNDVQYGDNRLPVVPNHLYRAEMRLGSDALHIAPNLEWVPRGAFADYRNTARSPGYTLLGLTGGASLVNGIDVFVDVRNITAKKAIGDISAVIQAAPGSAIYYPVERRAISGGVRARF